MALETKYITTLADATKFYYDDSELMELCTAFDVDLSYPLHSGVPHVAWARSLIQNAEHGNNRRFLRALVASLASSFFDLLSSALCTCLDMVTEGSFLRIFAMGLLYRSGAWFSIKCWTLMQLYYTVISLDWD